MFCPNTNSTEWKEMVAKVGEDQAYINWLNGTYVVQDPIEPLDQKPQDKLLSFLSDYGFEIHEAENLLVNLATKQINLDTSNIEQVSKAMAEPLSEMLSYSDYFYEVEKAVRNTERFKNRISELENELKDSTKRNLRRLATKEIFKDLLQKGFSEKLASELNIEQSLLQKIRSFIENLINSLKDANWNSLNKQVSEIVERTFKGDDFIRLTKKEGYKQVNFQEAFDENDIAKDIMTTIGTNDSIILTGSIAYATQGTVYRKIETVVHDLDFVNENLSEQEINDLVYSNYPGSIKAYSFFDKYQVDTFLVPPKGVNIKNVKRRDTGKITSYELVDDNGKTVGTYKLDYEVSSTGKTINEYETKTGTEAMLVDFFSNDNSERSVVKHSFQGSDGKTYQVNLSSFESPFQAKLRYSRFKDIWDYNRFIPEGLEEYKPQSFSYDQKSSTQEPIGLAEFESQRRQIENTFNSEIEYDETLETSATVKERGKKNVIVVNPNKLFKDTLVHEYGHIFIDALGGFDNPMIQAGYNQVKDTQVAKDIREQYSERPEIVIKKEILNHFIANEVTDMTFPKSKIEKFKRWLSLFFNRVKDMFGFQADYTKTLASKMMSISSDDTFIVDDIYDRKVKDLKFDSPKKYLQRKANALNTKLENYNETLESGSEGQQEFQKKIADVYAKMREVLDDYHDTKAQEAIVSFLGNADSVLTNVEHRLDRLKKQKDENGFYELKPSELHKLKEYIRSYNDLQDLSNMLSDNPSFSEQAEQFQESISKVITKHKIISRRLLDLQRKYIATLIAESDKSVTTLQYKDKFQTEFDQKHNNTGFWGGNKLNGKKVSQDEYESARKIFVNNRLKDEKAVIQKKEYDRMIGILTELPMEVGVWDLVRNTGDVNDDLIQEATEIIERQQREILESTIPVADEYNDVFEEFKKEHGISASMEKTFENLIDKELDINGNPTGKKTHFMSGEYNSSFYTHYFNYLEKQNELESEIDSLDETDPNYAKKNEELTKLLEERSKWYDENTEVIAGKRKIKDKWKNKLNLSKAEQKLRDFLIERRKETYENGYAVKSANLNKKMLNTTFYELPHVNKSGFEKITDTKNPFMVVSNWWQERFQIQGDDVDYLDASYKIGSEDNRLIQTQPIFFRKPTNDQSYDLLSIHLLDEHGSIKYNHHRRIIPTLEMLKEVAGEREVIETNSEFSEELKKIKNIFSKDKEVSDLLKKGADTRNYKILESYIGAMIYGDTKNETGAIAKKVDALISLTSQSIMAMNWIASIPNVLTGQVNKITDAVDISNVSRQDLVAGDRLYWADIQNITADLGNIRPKSKTNLLMEYFAPTGDFNTQYPEFAKSNKAKQIFDSDLAWANSAVGEHYIHAGLMNSVLHSVKLLNGKDEYIDKDGKVTKDFSKAASLIDYIEVGEKGLVFNKDGKFDKAIKTTESNTKLGKGLMDEVAFKMRDIAVSTQGLYAGDMWVHTKKYAAFRAAISLRGWMVPGVDRRWRGITNFKAKDESQRVLYSRRRGNTMSGSYTDTIRLLNNSKKGLMKLKFDVLGSEWEKLSSREKSNVREASLEAAVYGFLAVSGAMLTRLMGEIEDKEDARYVTHILYNMQRVKTEIGFYANPKEFFRIMRSPAPIISMMVDVIELQDQVLEDLTNWEIEQYERGAMKGEPKIKKRIYDVLPVFSQINRDVEKTLEYIQNPGIR